MRKYYFLCLVAIACLISSERISAAGLFDDLNVSGTFESEYWNHDPDDWTMGEDDIYDGLYTSLENTLSLNMDWISWYAELRLRSMIYDDQIHYDPESREHETDFEFFYLLHPFRQESIQFRFCE